MERVCKDSGVPYKKENRLKAEAVNSKEKIRILFLGHCSYYHVQNIADLLKKHIDNLYIAGANMIRPDGKEVTDSDLGSFDEFVSLPRKRLLSISVQEVISELAQGLLDGISRRIIFRYFATLRFGHIKRFLKAKAEEKKFSELMRKKFEEYDVFHFHYIGQEMLAPLRYIGRDKVVVLHIWGSDLLNDAGIESYKAQYDAIQAADYIIINTIEMTQYFLAKFGREFAAKVRNAYFVIDNEMMDRIANADKDCLRKKFTGRYGIDGSKIIIEAGYNASIWQKHLEIIAQLNQLPERLRSIIHVVIPMTYGLGNKSGDYLKAVKDAAGNAKFSNTVIDKFITTDEVLELVVSTEIKLNLRETDNLNTAMIESYCSDTIAVNGAWMPYGALRRLGVYYREIESIQDLSNEMEYLLNNLDLERSKTLKNKKLVREFFDNSKVAVDWIKTYEEVSDRLIEKRKKNATA